MKNIDTFNKITAGVFAELYEAFPKPVFFDCEKFRTSYDICDESGEICKATIAFLQNEGFLLFKSSSGHGHFMQLSLTLKGLALMRKVPEEINERKQSVGDITVEKIKGGAISIASDLILNAMQKMILG